MTVLVDSSVWSLSLRRRRSANLSDKERAVRDDLERLIRAGEVALIGVVRQELLSGLRTAEEFARVRDDLRAFEDEMVVLEDYERAAECFNVCRSHGVQGTVVDCLVCAVAERRGWDVFATDRDFLSLARLLPVSLYTARG